MRFQSFEWDDINVGHIARHGVEPYEVETACWGSQAFVLRGREGRYVAYGRTGSGRYLFIVFRILGQGIIHVITARDMSATERRFYQGRN